MTGMDDSKYTMLVTVAIGVIMGAPGGGGTCPPPSSIRKLVATPILIASHNYDNTYLLYTSMQ